MKLEASWLPGLSPGSAQKHGLTGETVAGAPFTVPAIDGVEAGEVATHVRRAALRARQTCDRDTLIAHIGSAALRLADPGDPIGALAVEALEVGGRHSASAAREILANASAAWSPDALRELVASELGESDAPAATGRTRRAVGPPLQLCVLAGNVPGVAVTAVMRGLLVRSGVLCKLPRSEPFLVPLFARALAEMRPDLAECLAATWWPADRPGEMGDTWVKRANQVVVYGSAATIRHYREVAPPTIPVIEYGPRTGVVLLGPETDDSAFEGLAADICAYDQAGCVSPRLVFVLGENPAETTQSAVDRLATPLSAEVERHRPLWITEAEAAAIRAARAGFQFGDPASGRAVGPPDLAWTLLVDGPTSADTAALPRVVTIRHIGGIGELLELAETLDGRVQTLALAGLDEEAEHAARAWALEIGASRVTRPGRMAWPPHDWRHDGRHQLVPLVRWTDYES